jgi:hypothetical protein
MLMRLNERDFSNPSVSFIRVRDPLQRDGIHQKPFEFVRHSEDLLR